MTKADRPKRSGAPLRGAEAQIGDQRLDVGQRLAVDEPHVAMVGDQRAGRFGFAADIDRRAWAEQILRGQRVVGDGEMVALMGDAFPGDQARDDGNPFPAIGVTVVMLAKGDARLFELHPVPGVDQVEAEAPAADVFDLQGHLGQKDRMVDVGLDGGDDLDAAGQRGQRGGGGPGFELVMVGQMRVDRVLRDQGGIKPQRLGLQHHGAVVLPRGVERFGGILQRGAGTMDRCPNTKPDGGSRHGNRPYRLGLSQKGCAQGGESAVAPFCSRRRRCARKISITLVGKSIYKL